MNGSFDAMFEIIKNERSSSSHHSLQQHFEPELTGDNSFSYDVAALFRRTSSHARDEIMKSTTIACGHQIAHRSRRGAALVETAVTLPVFFLFVWGLIEFGHAFMVINSINAAATKAARLGIAEGVTTAQVEARLDELLSASVDTTNATVYVKDASMFDAPGVDPTGINYSTLPSIELDQAEPRQLFVVRAEVPYNDVAIMPPFWITDVTLTGQSVMRHE